MWPKYSAAAGTRPFHGGLRRTCDGSRGNGEAQPSSPSSLLPERTKPVGVDRRPSSCKTGLCSPVPKCSRWWAIEVRVLSRASGLSGKNGPSLAGRTLVPSGPLSSCRSTRRCR